MPAASSTDREPVASPEHISGARRGLVLLDQVLSSGSNLLAVVLVARSLGAEDFGRFMLSYAALTYALALSRGYFGTRVALAADSESARALAGSSTASIGVVAPALCLVVLGMGLVTGGGRSILIVGLVALATPIVCMQDVVRFGAASSGRTGVAVASDGLWVLGMLGPLVLRHRLSPAGAVSLWLGSATAALLLGLFLLRIRPTLSAGLTELRRSDPVARSTAVGAVLSGAGTLIVLFVVSLALGPATAGSLRGASAAMGPVNVLLAFSAIGLTPVLVRRSRARDLGFCASAGSGLAAWGVAWGAVLLVIPARWGQAAFGPSWEGIRHLLPWTTAEYAALCVGATATLGLKVRGRASELLRQRIVFSGVTLAGGATMAVIATDGSSVAAALAAAAFVFAGVAWAQLLRTRVAQ